MFRFLYALFLVVTILVSFEGTNATQSVSSKPAGKQIQCGNDSSCCAGRDGRDGLNGRDGRDGRDGIQGMKGDKGDKGIKGDEGKIGPKGPRGDRGRPGKAQQGTYKFSDTADNCTERIEGTVRYDTSQKTLQLCNGSTWLTLLTQVGESGKGSQFNPGRHCLDILNSGGRHESGVYWIDPNGGSTDDSFQAFCDMETESGGWTLVATKVSPTLPSIVKPVFSALAAKTTSADAVSHIHPSMGDWKEVMFRFADVSTIRVIYNRKAGAPQKDKEEFDKFLMGKNGQLIKNVFGFYKYSPADHTRSPTTGFATINSLHFYSASGISESHVGSDKWLDMWNGAEGSNNYIYSDDSRARGTKCIAGYCYLNKPIWLMVR